MQTTSGMQLKLSGIVGAGKYAIVDPEDYPRLIKHKWYYRNGYALAKINGREVRMHRYVLNMDDPMLVVDHINKNRLDNRKSNLRVITHRENCNNRSDNVIVECFGEKKTVGEWATDERCIVSYSTLKKRLEKGIEPWAAILAPPMDYYSDE